MMLQRISTAIVVLTQFSLFIFGTCHVCIARAEDYVPEPGALYPWNPSSTIFIVRDGDDQETKKIRFLLSDIKKKSTNRTDMERKQAVQVMLNFDTALPDTSVCFNSSLGVTKDKKDINLNEVCSYSDFRETPNTVINGSEISIETKRLDVNYFGTPLKFDEFLPAFDSRSQGWTFTSFLARTGSGTVLWEKVYLVQTEGTYKGPRDAEQIGGSNIVESFRRIDHLLFGDKYFYLRNRTGDDFKFGNLIMRVDTLTGLPITTNKHIRAVDRREFQTQLDLVGQDIEQHYPKNVLDEVDSPRFHKLSGDVGDTYKWSESYLIDIPAVVNFRIQEHWFKGIAK